MTIAGGTLLHKPVAWARAPLPQRMNYRRPVLGELYLLIMGIAATQGAVYLLY